MGQKERGGNNCSPFTISGLSIPFSTITWHLSSSLPWQPARRSSPDPSGFQLIGPKLSQCLPPLLTFPTPVLENLDSTLSAPHLHLSNSSLMKENTILLPNLMYKHNTQDILYISMDASVLWLPFPLSPQTSNILSAIIMLPFIHWEIRSNYRRTISLLHLKIYHPTCIFSDTFNSLSYFSG